MPLDEEAINKELREGAKEWLVRYLAESAELYMAYANITKEKERALKDTEKLWNS